jgi:hypothetical protein
MQVLLFIYDLSFSCSPVFKDPCLRAAHFRIQSCRRYLPALLVFMSLRLACCRCARSLQRGAVFTASLSVRQAFLFQPGDFFLPTSSRFVSGGGFYIHRFFPSSPLLHFFSGPAFLRASDRFSPARLQQGRRGVLPLPFAVKTSRELFCAPSEKCGVSSLFWKLYKPSQERSLPAALQPSARTIAFRSSVARSRSSFTTRYS